MTEQEFGPYRLTTLLGRGGMGEVWRAVDTSHDDRIVALKLLGRWLSDDQDFARRFRRESAAAARVSSPHMVSVHRYGDIDGRLFIDMELVEGANLSALIERVGPLSAVRAVGIIGQTARALDVAHRAGLVHRDVKPSNILISSSDDEDDHAYLIDFGIARVVADTRISASEVVMGTLAYMAPERFAGEGDHRSDIYALGCVLHEALTGAAPFTVTNPLHLLNAHQNLPPPPPSTLRAGLPHGLDAVVAKALSKNPADRYQSAGELARAARQALLQTKPMTQAYTGAASWAPSAGGAGAGAPGTGSGGVGHPGTGAAGGRPAGTGPGTGGTGGTGGHPGQYGYTPPPYPSTYPPRPAQPAAYAPAFAAGYPPSGPTPVPPTRPGPRPLTIVLSAVAAALMVGLLALGIALANGQVPTPVADDDVVTTSEPDEPTDEVLAGDEPITERVMNLSGGSVTAVATTLLDGRSAVVSASDDYSLKVWDVADGTELVTLSGHTGAVQAVATAELGGAPIAVSGSDDGTIRIWDLTSGAQIGQPLTGHGGAVLALATTEVNGEQAIVSGGDDSQVMVWDLRTHAAVGTLSGHTDYVRSVATTQVNGVPVAVSAGDDYSVIVWDLSTGSQMYAPMTGHTDWVRSVTTTELNGVPVAVSAGDDASVRVWDLTTGTAVGAPMTGHTDWIRSVAATQVDGRPVAVTASDDYSLMVWDLAAGSALGEPLTGHEFYVYGVATTEVGGGPVAVSGGSDGTLRTWDLTGHGLS